MAYLNSAVTALRSVSSAVSDDLRRPVMNTPDRYAWAQEHLGEDQQVVYPGHPIVLAAMIMDRFPDREKAEFRDPEKACPSALGDEFIPGSGCAVYAALDFIRAAQSVGVPAALAQVEQYWGSWERQNAKNITEGARGREQAARLWPSVEQRLAIWGTDTDPGSPYRIADSVKVDAPSERSHARTPSTSASIPSP